MEELAGASLQFVLPPNPFRDAAAEAEAEQAAALKNHGSMKSCSE